ncbi:MAG: hypothetical protein OHK0013_22750 [Sandaracinaceae bacterium]
MECARLTLCESNDPTTCVALAPVGGPYPEPSGDGMQTILVPAAGGSLRFDARVDPTRSYDVEVVAYGPAGPDGSSEVVGVGRTSRVRFDGSAATVWLYPTDGWTCPGNTSTRLRRAFHQSVALSNGDALILGGIAFEPGASGLPIAGVSPTVALVPVAESAFVFDARTEEIVPVRVMGDARLLQRAFFEARWIERSAVDGKERVRLFGGVTGASVAELTLAPGRFPVNVRVDGAELAPTVTVLYDATSRTLEVETPTAMTFETIVETPTDVLPDAEMPRLTHTALVGGESSEPQFVTQVARVPALMGFGAMLVSTRRGATLTPVPGGWLVYGGNVADVDPALAAERVVLIGATDGRPRSLMVPAEVVPSVLHTASVVDGIVVLAGGLTISGLGRTSPVAASSPGPVLRAVRMTPAGDGLEWVPITGGDPERERIYHTSTRDERDRVIIVGGSTREGTSQFHAVSSVYAVDVESLTVRELPSLRTERFGHAAVLLPGGRLLVTGGLRRGDATSGESVSSLYMVEQPELLVVRPAGGAVSCGAATTDAGATTDAADDGGVDAFSTTDAPG